MDELLSRAMPHSPEAEQAVLGSMLIDADCVKDVKTQGLSHPNRYFVAAPGLLSAAEPGDLRDHLFHVHLLAPY